MTTTNYSWALPTVGASVNTWGTLVNNILIDIDANMFARTGGTISGNVAVTGQVTTTDNVGVGVTPSAWSYGGKGLELTNNGFISAAGANTTYFANAYYNGSNFTYKTSAAASYYAQASGAHVWSSAASGTAGNAITFTQAMTLDASGNLAVTGTGAFSSTLYMPQNNLLQWNSTGAAGGTNRAVVWGDSSGNLNFGNGSGNMTSVTIDASGNLLPGANGTQEFGSTSLRWSQVWCTAGAFNTSDATLKTPIRTMQAKELAAGYQMAQELGTFQWLESVKEKGDKARRHVGLTVQRAAEIMESHGLKPWSYGFMGYDKWDAVTEIVDATEDDDGAYQEEVTRQKTIKQTGQKQTVEIVNGKPVLKVETVESDVPVTEQIQVVDADGKPVFTDVPEVQAVLDEEGNEVTPSVPAHQVPMMHAVPVMETVTVWKRVKEVRPAGESYAFRSDQLAFFIAAGVAAKVGA